MPRLPRPLATAVVTAAGAVLLAGCTGQDQTTTTPTQAPVTTTSAAPTSVDPEAAAFCSQAQPLVTQFGNGLTAAATNVTAVSALLQQAVGAFGAVQAPTAIAQDWAASRDTLAGLRDTVAGIDPTAPDAPAKLQAAEQQAVTRIEPSLGRVQTYMQQNCGSVGATTAPTS